MEATIRLDESHAHRPQGPPRGHRYLSRERRVPPARLSGYRAEGFQALSKVEVKANGTTILAVLNVVDDERIVGELELGLSEEAFAQLRMQAGAPVTIAHAEPPQSIASLKRKIVGERLSRDEFSAMVRDIADLRYSKIELAAFVVALSQVDLDRDEVLHLTEAMVGVGRRLDWHEEPVVDKHCIGGIPGNRTSMLVVPIVAAHGMLMPKTSSRAITSPSGTADTMACLAEVELPFERLEAIVRPRGVSWRRGRRPRNHGGGNGRGAALSLIAGGQSGDAASRFGWCANQIGCCRGKSRGGPRIPQRMRATGAFGRICRSDARARERVLSGATAIADADRSCSASSTTPMRAAGGSSG